ncbi:MAG TPA: BrnT family toxin [Thermoanaerobaculia bacterium]|nr:BrnT family toxin [Thermoanaerobaculia bacterium]
MLQDGTPEGRKRQNGGQRRRRAVALPVLRIRCYIRIRESPSQPTRIPIPPREQGNVLSTYIRRSRIGGEEVTHERNGLRFIWDGGKAESNLRKHGISFETACELFFDPFVHLLQSEMLGGEEREAAIGMTEGWRLLVVVYTFRSESIRVISARPATLRERKHYESTADP